MHLPAHRPRETKAAPGRELDARRVWRAVKRLEEHSAPELTDRQEISLLHSGEHGPNAKPVTEGPLFEPADDPDARLYRPGLSVKKEKTILN